MVLIAVLSPLSRKEIEAWFDPQKESTGQLNVFRDWYSYLLLHEHFWTAQRVLQLLVHRLPWAETRGLLSKFVHKAEATEICREPLQVACSSAVQCYLYSGEYPLPIPRAIPWNDMVTWSLFGVTVTDRDQGQDPDIMLSRVCLRQSLQVQSSLEVSLPLSGINVSDEISTLIFRPATEWDLSAMEQKVNAEGVCYNWNEVASAALIRAADTGNETIISRLLDDAFLNSRNLYLQTALHVATKKDHEPVVRLLLRKGADAGSVDWFGDTAFDYAIRGSRANNMPLVNIGQCQDTEHYMETNDAMENTIRDLSKGLAEFVQHESRRTVQFIHQSVSDFLSEKGFHLLDTFQGGATAGSFAGRSHFRLSRTCIRYLAMDEIIKRYGPTKRAETGPLTGRSVIRQYRTLRSKEPDQMFTFMAYATFSWIPHAEEVEKQNMAASDLLSYFEPLSSLLQSWIDIYRMLIHRNTKSRPSLGTSIVHIASRYNLLSALSSTLHQDIEVDVKDEDGRTPLSCAAAAGHEAAVRLLLEQDIEVDSRDKDGRTPLLWAAGNGHENIVRLLVEQGAVDIHSKDNLGRTPLSWAATGGQEAVVRLLVEKGAVDVSPKDNTGRVRFMTKRNAVEALSRDISWGRTPLSWAAMGG